MKDLDSLMASDYLIVYGKLKRVNGLRKFGSISIISLWDGEEVTEIVVDSKSVFRVY